MNPFRICLLVVVACSVYGQKEERIVPETPRVFCVDPASLAKAKARATAGDKALTPALARLQRGAAQALKTTPCSVMDKALVPDSGDKHDYMSFGPYWWPDPDRKNGLPYIQRDGEVNPDSRQGDSAAMARMAKAVDTLALAYYFAGDEAHAAHAAQLLRTWFLDPETRMNPNLNFGQAIPGRTRGRGIGIIDTTKLAGLVDSIGLLEGSQAWTAADQEGAVAWFAAYLAWLCTSRHGKAEDRTKNNHGTWYDVQVASFALFTGKDDLAKQVLEECTRRRIASQIEPDGRQPHELRRTKSWSYSAMNLAGMFRLATLGERVGVDLWRFETEDGRGIRQALDFLAVYADPKKRWAHKQITRRKRISLLPLLLQAASVYGAERYTRLVEQLPQKEARSHRVLLLYQ